MPTDQGRMGDVARRLRSTRIRAMDLLSGLQTDKSQSESSDDSWLSDTPTIVFINGRRLEAKLSRSGHYMPDEVTISTRWRVSLPKDAK